MQSLDSMFKQRSRDELTAVSSQSHSYTMKEYKALTNQQKSQALVEFLSKKQVLQSLYDMMFLERLNHRASLLNISGQQDIQDDSTRQNMVDAS